MSRRQWDHILPPVEPPTSDKNETNPSHVTRAVFGTGKFTARMFRVASSTIAAIGYLDETQELLVTFRSNPSDVYIYKDVPTQVFQEFRDSTSLGAHHHRHIKGNFAFKKVAAE